MEYRLLGHSGLRVSALALGTMTFGGRGNFKKVGETDLAGARRQIDMCLDAGVNLIDTADIYSAGLAEEILGEALGGRRDRVLIATKVRFATGDGPNAAGLSRYHIVAGCEASLRRLRTDHIDLYQLHGWDGLTPLEETLAALDQLQQSGKVRSVGACNYAGWQLMKALGVAERERRPRFVSHQLCYSLHERSAEYELVPLAIDQGLGTLVWGPLAGGLLSGAYRRDQQPPAGSRRRAGWNEPPIHDHDALYDTIDVLTSVAVQHEVSPAQVALAWLLRRPTVASVLIGARTDQQLAENLSSLELVLSDEQFARLDDISRPPLIYPYWHQLSAADRLTPAELSLLAPYLP